MNCWYSDTLKIYHFDIVHKDYNPFVEVWFQHHIFSHSDTVSYWKEKLGLLSSKRMKRMTWVGRILLREVVGSNSVESGSVVELD